MAERRSKRVILVILLPVTVYILIVFLLSAFLQVKHLFHILNIVIAEDH